MFFAALISLSCVVLHLGQFHLRTDSGSVSIIKLQNEQVLELGKNLPISMTFPPFHSCLYFICLKNSLNETSPNDLERCLFCIIPFTFKFSTAIVAWFLLTILCMFSVST